MLAETNIQSKNSKYNDLKSIYKYRHTHVYICIVSCHYQSQDSCGGRGEGGGVTYFSKTHCQKYFKIFQVRLEMVPARKPNSS